MFDNIRKSRKKVIDNMVRQGNQYKEQEIFFREFWKAMRDEYTEENNTCSATFVLERFLSILPLKTIDKNTFIHLIEHAYEK